MLNRLVEIDNPGGGDCGYYSIAIGLIPIMQQELAKPANQRPTLSKYLSYFQSETEKEALTQDIREYNLAHPNRAFLTQMMVHLRNILYKKYVEDIHQHFEKNDKTIITDILGVFYYFYNNQSRDIPPSTYKNDFYRDYEFRKKMRDFVAEVKRFEIATKKNFSDPDIADLLRKKFFCSNEECWFNENTSEVGRVLKLKRHPRIIWATHADLNELADIFNVNLKTSGLGSPNYPFIRDERPILRLHHPSASHWTTMMSEVYLPDDRYKLKRNYGDLNKLSKEDILDVLNQYQLNNNKFVLFFRARKHLQLVADIKILCAHQHLSPTDIVQDMINTLPLDINTSGHYFSAVKFLCQKTHLLPELEKKLGQVITHQANISNKC